MRPACSISFTRHGRPRRLHPTAAALCLLTLLLLAPRTSEADDTPFEAIVNQDQAFVLSGYGGDGHVQTAKLKRGERVTVVRQDFSGWYMIEPPEGSFSWIRQDFVERRGSNTAIVNSDEAIDWIGSSVEQSGLKIFHKLSRGERVDILGEREFHKGSDAVPMFKIRPPRGEYRYINRRDVVKASEYRGQPDLLASSQADRPAGISLAAPEIDPFAETTRTATEPSTSASNPGGTKPAGSAVAASESLIPQPRDGGFGDSSSRPGQGSHVGPDVAFEKLAPISETPLDPAERQVIENAWEELERIDVEFREMVKRDSASWSLDRVRSRYTALRSQADSASLDRMLDQRLAAIDRYQKIQTLDNEIRSIMSQTEARDEEIRKSYSAMWHSASTVNPPQTMVRSPYLTTTQPTAPQPGLPSNANPQLAANQPPLVVPSGQPAPAQQLVPQPQPVPQSAPAPRPSQPQTFAPTQTPTPVNPAPPKFDGAGIIQRSASTQANGATHVLLAPNGRVLTYLQAGPGLNLDAYLGRAMGLTGPRSFRHELNADFMVVRRLTPVRLLP
ncbi:hypothetical protein GC176_06835 [bacterium]|nr:hypothetical protein [bacterium]